MALSTTAKVAGSSPTTVPPISTGWLAFDTSRLIRAWCTLAFLVDEWDDDDNGFV